MQGQLPTANLLEAKHEQSAKSAKRMRTEESVPEECRGEISVQLSIANPGPQQPPLQPKERPMVGKLNVTIAGTSVAPNKLASTKHLKLRKNRSPAQHSSSILKYFKHESQDQRK